MHVISLRDVSLRLRGIELFDAVNIDIEEGSSTAIVGPNGSGKSVLLRLMCRLMVPDQGEVFLASRFLDESRVFPDHFGVMIDGPGYIAGLSASENLMELASIRKRIGRTEVLAALDEVGLDPLSKKPVRKYSMGMRQRLGLAQALMEAPQVLILDEPFNALDEAAIARMHSILKARLSSGVTLVFTSHQPDDVKRLATSAHRIVGRHLEALF